MARWLTLALALVLGGCRFGVAPVDVDGDLAPDASVPDLGDGGDDLAVADLWSSDHAVGRDLSAFPDGAIVGGIGWPCSLGSDCLDGLCVEGFCCDQLCDPSLPQNLCKACNVPGFEGRCVLALDGTDPRGQCPPESPSTCGRDGTCDGKGACRRWAAGTACTAPACAAGKVTYSAGCDGNGVCGPPPAAVSCAPYKCADTTSCGTSCNAGSQCVGGTCLTNQTCGPRAVGQPCFTPSDCASGFCAQGVCCATDCNGNCASCATPGTIGTCLPVPAGGAPVGTCTAQTRASCGLDGKCDGAGNCRKWSTATPCAGPTCADATNAVAGRFCDGAGSCAPGVNTDCQNFRCNPMSASCFRAPCSSTAQCSGTNTCQANGSCN